MKAIILSFDKQLPYAELTYRLYMDLWPACPFTFRIPWNHKKPTHLENKSNIELINCDKDIALTIEALLNGINDNEWIYWCIDDRFPVYIDGKKMLNLYSQIKSFENYSFVKPFYLKFFPKNKPVFKGFVEQNSHHQWGYYNHHFCKAGLLRSLFSQKNCYRIYDFHKLLLNGFYYRRKGLRLPSTEVDYIKFEEPCRVGKRTLVGQQYLNDYGISG